MGKIENQVVPIFRIFDVDKAKEFYVDFLGCRIDREHQFETNAPIYMQVSRGNMVLHLSEHHGDSCPGSTAMVFTSELDALHVEITSRTYKYMRPGIEDVPWGDRLMELTDPFGNRLRFNEVRRDG